MKTSKKMKSKPKAVMPYKPHVKNDDPITIWHPAMQCWFNAKVKGAIYWSEKQKAWVVDYKVTATFIKQPAGTAVYGLTTGWRDIVILRKKVK